ALVAGCRGAPPSIDEHLMLTLEEARAWQHRADVHLEDGAVAEAIHDVEQVLAIAFPPGAAEGEETRLDAHARLAKLYLVAGDEARDGRLRRRRRPGPGGARGVRGGLRDEPGQDSGGVAGRAHR